MNMLRRLVGASSAASLLALGVATVAQAATEPSLEVRLEPTGTVVDGDATLYFTYSCTLPEGSDAASFDVFWGTLAQPYIRDRQGLAANQATAGFEDDSAALITCDGTPQTLSMRAFRFTDRVFHAGRAYAYNMLAIICYIDYDSDTGGCSDNLLPQSIFVQLRGT
jgi:hypothetical protein